MFNTKSLFFSFFPNSDAFKMFFGSVLDAMGYHGNYPRGNYPVALPCSIHIDPWGKYSYHNKYFIEPNWNSLFIKTASVAFNHT